MKRVVISTVSLLLGTAAATSAQLYIYIAPQCSIDTRHFLAKQAEQYVKAASEARNPEDAERSLQDAFRTLNDAITRGEEANEAVWYFFGRAYALDMDYPGADSAFTRVESLRPDCADDTDTYRYALWSEAWAQAVPLLQANDYANAIPHMVDANLIHHGDPAVPFYLAQAYAQQPDRPLGIRHFKETIDVLSRRARDSAGVTGDVEFGHAQVLSTLSANADSSYADLVELSILNIATLYHQEANWDSAAAWYAAYRVVRPDDVSTLQTLTALLQISGRMEEAVGYFQEMIDNAASFGAHELFSIGASLFQIDRYEMAAEAFQAGLAQNPYYRDGVYNLGQSYFALASPTDAGGAPDANVAAQRTEWAELMLEQAKILEEIDPLNVSSLALVWQAYSLLGESDSATAVSDRANQLRFEVVVTEFVETDTGFEMAGEIVNLGTEALRFPGLTFNWITAAGDVMGSDAVAAHTISAGPDGKTLFRFSPSMEGIVAWLYQVQGS
jgi:tetratricopeptide (TPR) repeat protein